MLRILVFGLSFVMLTAAAHAQTNVWTGPAAGDWGDPANWSLGVVPDDTTSVRIDANAGQDTSVLLESDISINSLALDTSDVLTITSSAELRTDTIENSGSIYVTRIGNSASPRLRLDGFVSNLPGGLISLDRATFSSNGLSPSSLLWNQGILEGSGRINLSSLWNEQLIDANVAGQTLRLASLFNSAQPRLINSGTLRASNGGIINLNDWIYGSIQNYDNDVPGTIEALGDSTVSIRGRGINSVARKIYGGRIATSNEGGIEEGKILLSSNISLIGVELDAMVFPELPSGIRLVDSTFANRKTIFIDNSSLAMEGTTILSGGGRIELSGNATLSNGTTGSNGMVSKFINVDNTISARPFSDAVFAGGFFFENSGAIEADGIGASLTLDLEVIFDQSQGTVKWANLGVIRAVNGGSVSINGYSATVYGDILTNKGGIIEVGADSSLELINASIQGGIVRGLASTSSSNAGFSGYGKLEDVRLEGVVNWNRGYLTLLGEIENTGTFTSNKELTLGDPEVTFNGGGELELLGGIRENNGLNVTSKLINADNTLRVNDDIFFDEVALVNRGTVEASVPDSNFELSFLPGLNSGDLTNSGTIRAINGANLVFFSKTVAIQNYEIDRQGNTLAGTIQAGTGSEIVLEDVIGGILQADEGGVIRILSGGSLNVSSTPVEMQLRGRVEASGNLMIAGTIRNDGLFEAGTVRGLGRVRLLGSGKMRGDINMSGLTAFFNGPEHTIMGSGVIRLNDNLFVNEGRIEARRGLLTIETSSVSNTQLYFRHYGELISSGGGTLRIGELFNWNNEALIESRDNSRLEISFRERLTNQGVIRITENTLAIFNGSRSTITGNQFINKAGAKIEIEGGMWMRDGIIVNEVGGTVTGSGFLRIWSDPAKGPRFFNNGTLAPGSFVGRLTFFDDYVQSATGDLEIELGGRLPEEFDSLAAGSVDLAGLLEVSLVDLGGGVFAPGLGDSFEIIDASITSEFDTFLLPDLAPNLVWGIQYNPESVVLEILAPLQTDFDADGDVDSNDFLLVQRDDPALIPQWQAEYGSRVITSLTSTQTVPEPSTALLAICAFATLATLQRKEKHLAIPG